MYPALISLLVPMRGSATSSLGPAALAAPSARRTEVEGNQLLASPHLQEDGTVLQLTKSLLTAKCFVEEMPGKSKIKLNDTSEQHIHYKQNEVMKKQL